MAVEAKKVWVAVIVIPVVLGWVWWAISSISASNARARATAEMERRQAALAAQAKRDALIAQLSSGAIPQWHEGAGRLRYVAYKGAENVHWSKDAGLCLEYWKIRDLRSPKDEFERRDRQLKEKELLETCMRDVRARVAQEPAPLVARCILKQPTYDFDKRAFTMEMENCRLVDNTTWFIRESGVGSDIVLDDGAPIGIVDDVTVRVPVEESKARDFKPRLAASPVLEVALEPGDYGPTKLSRPPSGFVLGPQVVEATKGRALAFRIVASGGPIIDWTLYGKNSEGRESIPKVLVDASIPDSKAQGLRERMSPKELEELRAELAKMQSPNRWPQSQRDRYVRVCMKAKKGEPSINRRVCGCYLEVMMERYATMGDFSKDLVNNGNQPDEKVARLAGMCVAAFGD